MDDDFIVTTFVVFDKTMAALGHRDQVLAQASGRLNAAGASPILHASDTPRAEILMASR